MLRVEDRGAVRWLILDRPEKRNAVPPSGWDELREALEEFEASGQRALVLAGTDGSFCAGADLSEAEEDLATVGGRYQAVRRVNRTALALYRLGKPAVAAVDGPAVGAGLGLALGCDLVLASSRARFSCLFVLRGLTVDSGVTWLLPRRVGLGPARDLALTGRMVDASEALALGLVDQVLDPAELEGRADELAGQLSAGAPLAQGFIKTGLGRTFDFTFEEALAYEEQAQTVCLSSEDAREGVNAFLEGRPPRFVGR